MEPREEFASVHFQFVASAPLVQDFALITNQTYILELNFELLISQSPECNRFTGKPYSSATGLYYYYQRWYDPSIGRFMSQDPFAGHLSDPQTLNAYQYASNQPTGVLDPGGLSGVFLNQGKSCPGIFQNFLGWLGCTASAPAIGPDLVIDPVGLYGDAEWLISKIGPRDDGAITACADNCRLPSIGSKASTGSTSLSVTSPSVTASLSEDLSATKNLVQTSDFFLRNDMISGEFTRSDLFGLSNGFGVPVSRALKVGQTFVGPGGRFAESGGLGQYVRLTSYDPELGASMQTRFDVGFISGLGRVDRLVLESYDLAGQILWKVHLPLI